MLNFSESCERNKKAILPVLQDYFADVTRVLEIGSGSGQHALYFSQQLPHLCWQPSDQPKLLPALQQNLAASRLPESKAANLALPLALDVLQMPWPDVQPDGVFTANTLHIMPTSGVEAFFAGLSQQLRKPGYVCIYGPFNYQGQFTSDSNARFDRWLKDRDPRSGIRDFEWICQLAETAELKLVDDVAMPANNRVLVFCLD